VVVLRGRCACTAVAYDVSDAFVAAYNCHCSNCRAMTGAAFLPVGRIERAKLTVTKGEDSVLVEGDPDSTYGYFGVAYGTLIDEPTLKPMYHQFVGSKAPGYEISDDLPQHDTRPTADR
jgi:hypothetical protein